MCRRRYLLEVKNGALTVVGATALFLFHSDSSGKLSCILHRLVVCLIIARNFVLEIFIIVVLKVIVLHQIVLLDIAVVIILLLIVIVQLLLLLIHL